MFELAKVPLLKAWAFCPLTDKLENMVHLKFINRTPILAMAGLDLVDSLFVNITLKDIMNICAASFWNDNEDFPKMAKDDIRNLLNISTKKLYFTFYNKNYKQVDVVASG